MLLSKYTDDSLLQLVVPWTILVRGLELDVSVRSNGSSGLVCRALREAQDHVRFPRHRFPVLLRRLHDVLLPSLPVDLLYVAQLGMLHRLVHDPHGCDYGSWLPMSAELWTGLGELSYVLPSLPPLNDHRH